MFSVILLVAVLAGVVLVSTLMTLNITVASGTLNGIIFYANVLGATGSSVVSNTISSILISWLNLKIGFDVCFFEGLDMYWKTWLQLAFPSYVILLVILITIVSEYSITLSWPNNGCGLHISSLFLAVDTSSAKHNPFQVG